MEVVTTLKQRAFENIVGTVENAGNKHYLLFPQCFLPYQAQILSIGLPSNLLSGNAFDKSKIVLCGNELQADPWINQYILS